MGWAISRVLNWSFEIRNVAKLSSFFVYTRTIRVSTFSCTMACPHSCKCTVYGLFLEFLLVKGCALLLLLLQLSSVSFWSSVVLMYVTVQVRWRATDHHGWVHGFAA